MTKSYEIGDPFYLTIADKEYEFEIMGFSEENEVSVKITFDTDNIK